MSEHYAWIAYPRKPFAPLRISSKVLWEDDVIAHAERIAPGRGPWRVECLPFGLVSKTAADRKLNVPDEFDDRHPQYLLFMAEIFKSCD